MLASTIPNSLDKWFNITFLFQSCWLNYITHFIICQIFFYKFFLLYNRKIQPVSNWEWLLFSTSVRLYQWLIDNDFQLLLNRTRTWVHCRQYKMIMIIRAVMPCGYWILNENSPRINENSVAYMIICKCANNSSKRLSGRIQTYSWIIKVDMVRQVKTNWI